MVSGHIRDTPEDVEIVEVGDAGDAQGGSQGAEVGSVACEGGGEQGEAPWVRLTVNKCKCGGLTFQALELIQES